MVKASKILAAAPHMKTWMAGVESFRHPKAAYARGGGTPSGRVLEDACLLYLASVQNVDAPDRPYVLITSSGQAANHLVFKGLRGGDMVSSKHLFGSTKVDLDRTFAEEGGHVEWADPTDTQSFIDRTTSRTTAWFVEAVSNPTGRVPELQALRNAAKERGLVLVLDVTLAVGMPEFRPLEYADVVTVSLTKQAGGGLNENMAGAVIINPRYPWIDRSAKFPKLTSYFSDAQGDLVLPSDPFGAMLTKIGTHEGSAALAPRIAWSIAKLLPGLDGRVRSQCVNARALAELMAHHAAVESVYLAGFQTDPANDERAQRYFGSNHFVILCELRGGVSSAERFIDAGQLMHAVALGQRTTAVAHPASSTHRHYTELERSSLGIHAGTIRISVGTEPRHKLRRKILAALDAAGA